MTKEKISEQFDAVICKQFKADIITDGPLYQHIAALAEKAGVKIPTLFQMSSGIANAAAIPAADKPRLLLSDGLFKILNSSSSGRFAPELDAIILHEMSHLNDGYLHGMATRYLPLALMPIAGVMAYRYVMNQAKGDKSKPMSDLYPHDNDPTLKPFKKQIVDAAQEIAIGGGGGFVAGLEIAKHASLYNEYAADRFAALHSSPDAVVNGLRMLYTPAAEAAWRNAPKDDPFIESLRGENWFMDYIKSRIHAHPSLEQRIGRLNVMKEASPLVEEVSHVGKLATMLVHSI